MPGKKHIVKEFICSYCGTKVSSHSRKSIYCSDRCGQLAATRRRAFDLSYRMNGLAGSAKHRAKSKGLPFDIDRDFLLKLWEDQEGRCALTKELFDLRIEDEKLTTAKRNSPSIDRIEPSKGYVKGNVRLVTFQVNMAKGFYTDEDFYDMCRKALEARN